MTQVITVEDRELKLTNLDKIYWPELKITKGDMINYYVELSPYLLPHLKNRPFSMKPFPDGIYGDSFYQKEVPKEAPSWYRSTPIPSGRRGMVNWGLINDLPSLVWIANRGCIEMHTWFSRLPNLATPDVAVLDLDPSPESPFTDVIRIALLFKQLLDDLKLHSFPKTSGMSGMHIYIPIKPIYPFSKVRDFLVKLCTVVQQVVPDITTLERTVQKRGRKIYLDAVQNASAKTIPAPYSLRPSPHATVSAPLLWDEVTDSLAPEQFTLFNIGRRLKEKGELFAPLLELQQELPSF